MDSIQPNRPIPPTKNTKADDAAPSAQSVAKFNEAFNAPQIGSSFPMINERQQADDVLINNPNTQESYWVPKGAANNSAMLANTGNSTDPVLTDDEIKKMTPFELGAYWLCSGAATMKNEINFKDNSEISRIFSQGNGAKYFEDKFYEKFNGSPKENDKINNFAYTFTWNPRATHTTNPAEQLVGSWQGGEATVKGNNVYFRIHNTIGANSLFFGRQLGEHGITPVGQTKNDIHMTIEWTIPLRKVLK